MDLESRPEVASLRCKPWAAADFSVPAEVFGVETMLTHEERRMLFYLALVYYRGDGEIADMGAFLGGSTMCFAAALRQRSIHRSAIHSYDLFRLSDFERERYFRTNPPEGLRTRQIFDRNLADYRDLIVVHEGDVLGFSWEAGPIELLFVDIAKSHRVFDHIVTEYFPALVPGRSLVIMQDYLWGQTGPWHHVVMEKLSPWFEYVADTTVNSVIFWLRSAIPPDVLEACRWTVLPAAEKLDLMARAIGRLDSDAKRAYLREARTILLDGRDMTWGLHYHELAPGEQ